MMKINMKNLRKSNRKHISNQNTEKYKVIKKPGKNSFGRAPPATYPDDELI